MSSQAVSNFPLMAGKAVVYSFAKSIGWLFNKLVSSPFLSAVVVVMGAGSLMSASNALFLQKQSHPAPFFSSSNEVAYEQAVATNEVSEIKIAPSPIAVQPMVVAPKVIEKTRPLELAAPTPKVSEAVAKIDHAQVILLQKKLASFGFFNGEADGFYGPQTAEAIRAFEISIGKNPVGALTPELVKIIQNYNVTNIVEPVASLEIKIPASSSIIVKEVLEPVKIDVSRPVVASSLLGDPLLEIVKTATIQKQKGLATNSEIVKKVQLGLSSLGFLHGSVDGVLGETTAKAIREFEVFHNYKVSGKVSPELLDMLKGAGANI
jgi:peptidoglycan hydrolase-like protein with peptidoglycan-binding domain